MKKFILLYDCPFIKCDKLWLYNGLIKYGDVKVIDIFPKTTYLKMTNFMSKIKLGKILLRLIAGFQSLRAILSSNNDDIIVVWNNFGGILMNQMLNFLHLKRKVASFCWIEIPKIKNYKKVESCLNNKNFMPIINDKNLENEFISMFNLDQWNGIMLSDVFDDSENFISPVYKKEVKKYCFAGGYNNRDWEVLIKAANILKKIDFVIITSKNAIKNYKLPSNVRHLEQIEKKEYYNLMKNAYITICPLKENRVSGLINIIKSTQYGIPCITTKFDLTTNYFPKENRDNSLYTQGNVDDLINKINYFWHLEENNYINYVDRSQEYIKKNFSPEKNVENLFEELKKRKWI